MSFWNISSNAASTTTDLNGWPVGIDNDQGTIRAGGNIGSTSKFTADAVSLGVNRVVTVVSGISAGVTSSAAAGTFNGGNQVIRRVTTDLAGVSQTALLSGGSNSANRPFSIKRVAISKNFQYKTAVRTGKWHEFSGVWSTAPSVATSGIWSQATDTDVTSVVVSSGVDNAAHPTQAIPGEFTYRKGGPNPVNADYAAKTVF